MPGGSLISLLKGPQEISEQKMLSIILGVGQGLLHVNDFHFENTLKLY